VCALQMLKTLKLKQQPLSKLSKCWTRYPQLVTNIKVREKKPFEQLGDVLNLVSQAEAEVSPQGGRVLLRYSGTEPKARLLIEGRDAATLQKWSTRIMESIKKQVGI
jgi:phosphoglucosamine mutase